nr:ATP-binding protein [Deinococcus xianganensis]
MHSAVADLVDNAIDAGARHVSIQYDPTAAGTLTIQDDGQGLTEAGLIQAMQIGTRHGTARAAGDLGRFGTGLKAAALYLSRGGRFHVSSAATPGEGAAVRLDTARMQETGRWLISVEAAPHLPTGTTLLIDRPMIATDSETASAALQALAAHLRCVFSTHMVRGLTLSVQGRTLEPWRLCDADLPEMVTLSQRRLGGGRVLITPFILPTHTDDPMIEGPQGRRAHAGFHVHRAGRAITLGGWLGLGVGKQHRKASDRVRLLVEIDPGLDQIWRINLSKSACTVPDALRPTLRKLLDDVLERAGKQRSPRRRAPSRTPSPDDLWVAGNMIRRDHPLVQQVRDHSGAPDALEQLLVRLEQEGRHG